MSSITASDRITATPKKLNNGSWGVWASSEDVAVGTVVTVATRSGKTWDAQVTRIIWRGKGGAICETRSVRQTPPARRAYRPSRSFASAASCGYPCPVTRRRCTPSDPCHDCQ